jgi:hypothetical protein
MIREIPVICHALIHMSYQDFKLAANSDTADISYDLPGRTAHSAQTRLRDGRWGNLRVLVHRNRGSYRGGYEEFFSPFASCWLLVLLTPSTRHVFPKRWSTFSRLHGVMSQTTKFFIFLYVSILIRGALQFDDKWEMGPQNTQQIKIKQTLTPDKV